MSGHDAGFTHVQTFIAAHLIHRMASCLAVSRALFIDHHYMFEPCSLLETRKHMLTLKRNGNYKAIKHAPVQEFAKRTESCDTWLVSLLYIRPRLEENLQKSEQEHGSGCCSQHLQFTNM